MLARLFRSSCVLLLSSCLLILVSCHLSLASCSVCLVVLFVCPFCAECVVCCLSVVRGSLFVFSLLGVCCGLCVAVFGLFVTC